MKRARNFQAEARVSERSTDSDCAFTSSASEAKLDRRSETAVRFFDSTGRTLFLVVPPRFELHSALSFALLELQHTSNSSKQTK